MQTSWCLIFIVVHLFIVWEKIEAEEPPNFYLKGISRPHRSSGMSKNIAEMGEFFKKASKSIPRIGRRNDIDPIPNNTPLSSLNRDDKRPFPPAAWGDIAETFEYNPELFAAPDLWMTAMADDPSAYDWGNIRVKRSIPARFNVKN